MGLAFKFSNIIEAFLAESASSFCWVSTNSRRHKWCVLIKTNRFWGYSISSLSDSSLSLAKLFSKKRVVSSVIGKRANLKTGVSRKRSMPNFPINEHFLPSDTHTYVFVSGGTFVYQGVRGVCFWKIWCALLFWNTYFDPLFPYYQRFSRILHKNQLILQLLCLTFFDSSFKVAKFFSKTGIVCFFFFELFIKCCTAVNFKVYSIVDFP